MKLNIAGNHASTSKAWQVLKPLQQYFDKQGIDTVWGLGSGNFDIIKNAIAKNLNWLFTDMPYWGRYNPGKPDAECYWRTCINGIHCNKILDLPNDRCKNITLKEWRDQGEYILVAPSSATVHRFINKANWTQDTVAKLKKLTDIPIKIREKPRKNGTSGPHVADVPLAEDLSNARYVVTSCSVVGVEAVIQGIPTFCEPESACAPVSNTDIFSLEPVMSDRQKWLNTLSYHQWTPSEIQNGELKNFIQYVYGNFQ